MLTQESIVIEAKPRGLNAAEFAIRKVSKAGDGEDTGWRFQAVVRNDSSASLSDLEFALRYYDSGGKFLGLDEGFAMGPDELAKGDDKSVDIMLDIPVSAAQAVFLLKAKKTNFLEKHNFLIFGAAFVVAAVLYFLGEVFGR